MSIQKPYDINIRNKVIDFKNPVLVSWKTSGDTSASFSINIYNNQTGVLVWSLPRSYSYAMSYIIPANSIVNGIEYKMNVVVWSSSSQTATSQLVVFTASSTPVITVPTIGTIGNHTNLFTGTYSQAENDPISTYVINLYNAQNVLLKTSGIKTDGLVEYRFDLMKNNLNYYVEFIVTSKKGLTASSGQILFSVVYENPSMYFELNAETIAEKASVKLDWSVVQVIGKTTIEPVYIANEELNITNGKLFFDEGFEIVKNFTLKVWFRQLARNTDLIYLRGSNGTIRIQYKDDNKFHMYKDINGYLSHYTTPSVVGSEFFLCVQQINGHIDIISEVIV